jgi:predicted  nucleic acid-binding Zn-ribbon protein
VINYYKELRKSELEKEIRNIMGKFDRDRILYESEIERRDQGMKSLNQENENLKTRIREFESEYNVLVSRYQRLEHDSSDKAELEGLRAEAAEWKSKYIREILNILLL